MFQRKRLAVVGLLGALVAGGAAVALPASAVTGTRLCHGYDDCRAHGYSDHGYEANGGGSYWNMYTGHNCTNYVAFRLVQGGMANLRPPADPGRSNAALSAYLWGLVYASKTDNTPAVGSVAWWGAGAAGSIGHVAYVERVDGNSITVSEDSSSGNDFDWKTITRGQGWPTGFIHFNDGHHADAPLPAGGVPVGGGGSAVGGRGPTGSGGARFGGDDMPAAVARGDFGGDVSGASPFGGVWTGGWDPAPSRVVHAPAAPAKKTKAKPKVRAKKPARSHVGHTRRPGSHNAEVPASMFGGGEGFGHI